MKNGEYLKILATFCGNVVENGFPLSPEGARHISPGQAERR
jgi:hypothetical protein